MKLDPLTSLHFIPKMYLEIVLSSLCYGLLTVCD